MEQLAFPSLHEAEQASKKTTIEKPKLVLCEGYEETVFLPRILKLTGRLDLYQSIQFMAFNGKSKLEKFLTKGLVQLPGYSKLTSLGIMIDSNGQPEGFPASLQKVQGALGSIGWPVPQGAAQTSEQGNLRSIIWVLPDNESLGEFEDLCMKALAQHPLLPCIDIFLRCAQSKAHPLPSSAKAPLYTVLAWTKPCGRRLGELDDAILCDWQLQAFQPLIDTFLSRL